MKSVLERIPSKVSDLIESHAKELEDAWANTGEGTLAIAFPVKIGVRNGKRVCEVGISFVMEKCQDSTVFEWDDRQLKIFEPIKKLQESLNEGESITLSTSAGHEPVTLEGRRKVAK